MKRILIIGATSRIAEETARLYAVRGAVFFLAARNQEHLGVIADDLKVRGAGKISMSFYDALSRGAEKELVEAAVKEMGTIDLALIAHGILPDQDECEWSYEKIEETMRVNLLSAVACCTALATCFEKERRGSIAVLSSVAADRGRRSNYVYGSSKAGLDAYLQGLRNRLFRSGVHILTIKPGFVDTPMTAGLKKMFLVADARDVAKDIYRAVEKKKDTLYTPWFWRWIMLAVKLIPEGLFKRLKL